ncbi:MAG: AraC family transcriptional regulator [Bacteroidaceae bacterium]|nr:AraC family transcriptional regulator [Bacteroidaceae bacterium]
MPKYNISEKKDREAVYRMKLRPELVEELYEKIQRKLILEKKYRDPDFSARRLAEELGTNTRYVSAVVNLRYQQNYSSLVNDLRIREALYLLIDPRYAEKSIEDIARMVGFSNRQSFYAAFFRVKGLTPREYRQRGIAPKDEGHKAMKEEMDKD